MENKIKQLRKGVLELAIMGCLSKENLYGYSLIRSLAEKSGLIITEGTIYPILNRLSRENLVKAEWMESKQGPPRKYYSLTSKGQKAYKILSVEFDRLSTFIHSDPDTKPAEPKAVKGKILQVKKEKRNA